MLCSKGVYININCNDIYIGQDIILYVNNILIEKKQCPLNSEVNFYLNANNFLLPITCEISNSLNNVIKSEKINVYSWYDFTLEVDEVTVLDCTHNHTDSTGYKTFNKLTSINNEYFSLSSDKTAITLLKTIKNATISLTQYCSDYYKDTYSLYVNSSVIITLTTTGTKKITRDLNIGDKIKLNRTEANANSESIQLIIKAVV